MVELSGRQLFELWLKGGGSAPFIQDYRQNKTYPKWDKLPDWQQNAWNTLADNSTITLKAPAA